MGGKGVGKPNPAFLKRDHLVARPKRGGPRQDEEVWKEVKID